MTSKRHLLCLSLWISLAQTVYATDAIIKPSKILKNSPCSLQVQSLIKKWGTLNDWHGRLSPEPNEKVIIAPTQETGVWVRLATTSKNARIARMGDDGAIEVLFVSPKCEGQLNLTANKHQVPVGTQYFNNKNLVQLLEDSKKKNTRGVIYIWSPYMTYSVRGIKEVTELAKKQNWELTTLMDFKAQKSLAEKIKKTNSLSDRQLRRVASTDLYWRGVNQHFPTYIFYKNGKILSPVRPGYDDTNKLKKFAERVFQE